MKEEEEKKIYETEFGFSRIVELMIESKIPLIGHNCMYDICFFYRQFIGHLPETWEQFKKAWLSWFPYTYDTKIITQQDSQFSKTTIEDLIRVVNRDIDKWKHIEFRNDLRFNKYKEEEIFHEAGYDAMLTGIIFGSVAKSYELKKKIGSKADPI